MPYKYRKDGVKTNLFLAKKIRNKLSDIAKTENLTLSRCIEMMVDSEWKKINRTENSNNIEGSVNVGNNATTGDIYIGALDFDRFAAGIKQQFTEMDAIRDRQLKLLNAYEHGKVRRSKSKSRKNYEN